MTLYAHITAPVPQRLPNSWQSANGLIMGLPGLSSADLAEFGWYPVRYEPLEPGADGYGEIVLINGVYVVKSLPADPEISLSKKRAEMVITALQGMRAIKHAGLVEQFINWKNSLDPINDFETIAFFEKAQTWERKNEFLIQGATALKLTDEQLDDLFAIAMTL